MSGSCVGLEGGLARRKEELRKRKESGLVCWRNGCVKMIIVPMRCETCGHVFCPTHRHSASHSCNATPSSSRGSTPQPSAQPSRPAGRAAMSRLLPPSMQVSSSKSITATKPIITTRPTPLPAISPRPVPASPQSVPSSSQPIPVSTSPFDARAAAASAALKRAGQDVKVPFVKSKTDKRADAEMQSTIQALKARHDKGLLSKTEEIRYAELVGKKESARRSGANGLGGKDGCVRSLSPTTIFQVRKVLFGINDMDGDNAGPSRPISRAKPTAKAHALPTRQRTESPVQRGLISLSDVRLDEHRLDRDIALLISQYLDTHHPSLARQFDEEVLGQAQSDIRHEEVRDVERAILDGDYGSLEDLLSKPGLVRPQTQKAFLYVCFRQQFLECINNRESQKAFNHLQKRLKPLEHFQPVPYDFLNLGYLTTASTVHDAPAMRDWGGVGPERERLVATWREIVQSGASRDDTSLFGSSPAKVTRTYPGGGESGNKETVHIPPDRLKVLLRQAAAWQVSTARRKGTTPWAVPTLLKDYEAKVIPDRLFRLVFGHRANVKCVDSLGSDLFVSGSRKTGTIRHVLAGHKSRIWDCAASSSSSLIASASGDGMVRIWSAVDGVCQAFLEGQGGDVYGVRWRPGPEDQVVSASYDQIVRLWDVEKGKQIHTFSGHTQSTLAVAFDPTGKMIASGSKDKHIRLWDAVGGMSIHTTPASLGEVTSVEIDSEGRYLLAGFRDNSNGLLDLRMRRTLYRYTGHQNTAKNLIRCSFTSTDLIIGGSEDGLVYVWDREAQLADPAKSSPILSPNRTKITSTFSSPHTSPRVPRLEASSMSTSITATLTDSMTLGPNSSPALYPPRDLRSVSTGHSWAGITVRSLSVLEGHGDGAVFDVKWSQGGIISAGEDGAVGVWGVDEDEDQE
ncbi:MAG: hypothetical protein TREMPRED_005131 [Tremellales sp. Tagirdzhanova-0007]|nr:MAG: hypothetical protein TREMPRED_005131 [Tremellales sp. Tagirdzhanova-0007]